MRTFIFISIAIFTVLTVLVVGIGPFFTQEQNPSREASVEESRPDIAVPENAPDQTELSDTATDRSTDGFFVQVNDGTAVDIEQFVTHASAEVRAENFYRATYDPDIYSIYYNSSSQVIFIDLYQQPIPEAKQFAEAHLLEVLDLPEEAVCDLNITVQTNGLVDSAYADKDIGLSFCE